MPCNTSCGVSNAYPDTDLDTRLDALTWNTAQVVCVAADMSVLSRGYGVAVDMSCFLQETATVAEAAGYQSAYGRQGRYISLYINEI